MNSEIEITVDDMPNEDLKLIAKIIGVDIAIAMVETMPGAQIQIPKNYIKGSCQIKFIENCFYKMNLTDDNISLDEKVKQFVGDLQKEYGGLSIYIPTTGRSSIYRRAIIAEFDGTNANDLCVRYGVSRKHIYNITKKKKSKLPSLFS